MAYEIQLDIGTPGLSGIYCRSWQGSTGGATIALSEIAGAGGVYGNAGVLLLSAGEYVLRGYDSADSLIARSGVVVWDGSEFAKAATAANQTTIINALAVAETMLETIDKTGTKTLRRRD